jgi:threonine synthase
MPWSLECSHCDDKEAATGLPTVCPRCGDPWLVRYDVAPPPEVKSQLAGRPWDMWRYREWLPVLEGEVPVSLGEGMTPLPEIPRVATSLGVRQVWVKDEGQNPCGSFKARGLSAAVTRAVGGGARRFTIPTAGNAGVALSAYGQRAGLAVRVYAPRTTPATILRQIEVFGADLQLLDGHIGDCGKASRAYAESEGAMDVSTLREPYRIEGKKTLGLELAEQLGWSLPDCILYPTGGGTGLIGMWKAFHELRDAGWISGALPRLYSVQADGCQPVVKAFEVGASATEPWPDPQTVASGLRVPAPLGGKIMLKAIRETGGTAVAVSDSELEAGAAELASTEGIDACPEGGASLAALRRLLADGIVQPFESVVLFNTGAGWLYR